MGPPCFGQPHSPLFTLHYSLAKRLVHATGRAQCRHKGGDCGYYNLHRDVNNSLPLHLISSSPLISFLIFHLHSLTEVRSASRGVTLALARKRLRRLLISHFSFTLLITHFSFLIWQEAFRPLPFNLRLPGRRCCSSRRPGSDYRPGSDHHSPWFRSRHRWPRCR